MNPVWNREQTLVVECRYGWGQVMRLYTDHIELQGAIYALRDLIHFRPAYRRLVGMAAMRLELQFRSELVCVRGISDVDAALQATMYLNHWLNVQSSHTQEQEISEAAAHLLLPDTVVDAVSVVEADHSYTNVPGELNSANSTQALPESSLVVPQLAFPEVAVPVVATAPPIQAPARLSEESVASWIRVDERKEQRIDRLQALQIEREKRLYGFNVDALANQLRRGDLPRITVPVHLLQGEIAHYRTDAMLCDEAPPDLHIGGTRWKPRDRGTFILTNKRMIFQGRKRQLVLYYERLLQCSHLPGAILLHAQYWTRQQFFAMRRPLECAMYMERILQDFHQATSIIHQLPQPL